MPHFFVDPRNISGDNILISGDEAHHLINVRRVTEGEELHLFDGTGKQYIAKVKSIAGGQIQAAILSQEKSKVSKVSLTVYQSIPKGDRADWLVEKFTEIGVSSFIPLVTERSVIKEVSENKKQRWERLSMAAAQQCLRPDLMNIKPAVNFIEAAQKIDKASINVIPWEGADVDAGFEQQLAKRGADKQINCNIFIGPEGGFTIGEIETAKSSDLVPVSLGSRILRTETAGLVAAVLALSAFGEFGKK